MHLKTLIIFCILWLSACSSLQWSRNQYDGQSQLELPDYSTNFIQSGDAYEPRSDFYLQWPVGKVRISQTFRPHRNKKHEGVDLTHYFNAPIYAAHEGYVVYVGNEYSGYGKMIILQYSNKWATLYAHLNKIEVKEGQVVERGELIGRMGKTGRVTGTHLHFELLKNKVPIDPMDFLPYNRSVAHKNR
ncbi:MAG: M23 family metallopeptidase [Bdellovibrionales bacterium]|nr:M23 family metallopeptidase [Bdellovibrionales bacterium]